MNHKISYKILIGVLVVVGIVIYAWSNTNQGKMEEVVLSAVDMTDVENDHSDTNIIYVQVSGQVMNPGIYQLSAGSRVYQAVDLAGGTTTSAALEVINQASLLEDGMHVHFPAMTQGYEENGLININLASKEELETIAGIGEAKVISIIKYREENGHFKTIEDIMLVAGIKEGLFTRIEDYITIY